MKAVVGELSRTLNICPKHLDNPCCHCGRHQVYGYKLKRGFDESHVQFAASQVLTTKQKPGRRVRKGTIYDIVPQPYEQPKKKKKKKKMMMITPNAEVAKENRLLRTSCSYLMWMGYIIHAHNSPQPWAHISTARYFAKSDNMKCWDIYKICNKKENDK